VTSRLRQVTPDVRLRPDRAKLAGDMEPAISDGTQTAHPSRTGADRALLPLVAGLATVLLASCGADSSAPALVARPTGPVPTTSTSPLPLPSAPVDSITPAVPTSAETPDALPGVPQFSDRDGFHTLRIVIEEMIPHDTGSFTQGLLLSDDGRLFESAGQYGASTIREVDPRTGAVVRVAADPPDVFAEGLELVDDRLIQLTWMEEIAYVWDVDTFEIVDSFAYQGEGWGLCLLGSSLVMSDGSPTLTFRDPESFEALETVDVTFDGVPLERINELECVGDHVFANVWRTTFIVVIDPVDGRVVAVADAAALVDLAVSEFEDADVLNGIAYDDKGGTFHLTGKHWPFTFVVRFENA